MELLGLAALEVDVEVNVDEKSVPIELDDECNEWEEEIENSPDEVLNGNGGGVGILGGGGGGERESSESSAKTRPGLIIRGIITE